ncbi:hypothetical protein MNBD_GAMMA04-597 [hydrothermal vent metagenome]|uniref:Proline rich signal peptide protein n=1 Tax=hydrothermal vent metagenome TaxID=652676 RepID=A0A3B0WUM6_9ZZZZ
MKKTHDRFLSSWRFLALLIFILCAQTSFVWAKDAIHFSDLKEIIQDQKLALNAKIDFKLPEQVVSAIHHDISILFKTEIILLEEKPLLGMTFERVQKSIEYHTELYAYGVNRYYVLYNHRNHKRQTFQTLEEALQTLGTLQTLPVINLAELHPEQTYFLKIRVSLDKWRLPPPLLIDALLEPYWQLDSGWQVFKIRTQKSWQ